MNSEASYMGHAEHLCKVERKQTNKKESIEETIRETLIIRILAWS